MLHSVRSFAFSCSLFPVLISFSLFLLYISSLSSSSSFLSLLPSFFLFTSLFHYYFILSRILLSNTRFLFFMVVFCFVHFPLSSELKHKMLTTRCTHSRHSVTGGELFNKIVECSFYSEKQASATILQVCVHTHVDKHDKHGLVEDSSFSRLPASPLLEHEKQLAQPSALSFAPPFISRA